jgi:exodeoxyribonuclease V gamma subunit
VLTLYRSNRAELLAQVLATRLWLEPPGPLDQIQVVVNTWPTSRWLAEQIALASPDPAEPAGGGIAANLRFPFPASRLRALVDQLLAGEETAIEGADPWRAQNLVWPVLELLPALLKEPEAAPLRQWLERRGADQRQLDRPLWQLGRAIADALDDYGLYRPAMLEAWLEDRDCDAAGQPLAEALRWQPLLLRRLAQRLTRLPFGLRARQAMALLQQGHPSEEGGVGAGQPLRLFGLSSLAPVQVELLQALSQRMAVELYLLTPCRDLWQRHDARSGEPLGSDWLLEVPGLEARFGRLGAEFQQLLEASGETQPGTWDDYDAFFLPATAARGPAKGARGQTTASHGRSATLLEQLQELLATGETPAGEEETDEAETAGASGGEEADTGPAVDAPADAAEGRSARLLHRAPDDRSLEFHACPGRLRQLQIVRDRLLQLLAADDTLEPRDILVMTPQVEAFAPLVGAVFGDSEATGVALPWRLTDRSQQSESGISQGLLTLLQLAGDRLTATALEAVLSCGPLLQRQGIDPAEAGEITALLQRCGFRWGLDARARAGDPCHSFSWAIDRLVLGLILPETPGLAPAETAPLALTGTLEQQGRWLALLRQLRQSLTWLGQPRTVADWVQGLRDQLPLLFGDGGERAWELQGLQAVLADWKAIAGDSPLLLEAPVVAEVLAERLSEGSGRFGHRSGALTISALEPMRAIPHKVVVLLGLDAGAFPRQRQRPGFHLLEQQRRLGDPNSGDQDRYVLLESLLSARAHLLISWSNRDERTGEGQEPAAPVRQWLDLLAQQLKGPLPLREHAASPLERRNFLAEPPWPPASCDLRLLQARRQLEQAPEAAVLGLAWRELEPQPSVGVDEAHSGRGGVAPPSPADDQPMAAEPAAHFPAESASPAEAWADLRAWIEAPQARWLEELGLRPREWDEPVRDLEDLQLDERRRASLLRAQLDGDGLPPPEVDPDWAGLERGRGVLPPRAAGELEVVQLQTRWRSLQACLEGLGPAHHEPASWQGLEAVLPWRGDQLVLAHTARPRCRQRLRLWLELLLASAAGHAPTGAALVGRDKQRFRLLEQIQAPTPSSATELLEQLIQWREEHRLSCWPLPPETGWAYAAAEAAKPGEGRGWSKAREAWEGGFHSDGERRDPVQALCFGSDQPLAELLTPAVEELALALHGPMLELRQEVKA